MRAIAASVFMLIASSASSAFAAVQTTGCASATTCTLAELYAGGTIKVDDVTFGGFSFLSNVGQTLDATTVLIDGVSGGTTAQLQFNFSPDVVVRFDNFLGYNFDFTATVDGASARRIAGSTLSFVNNDSLAIVGDALSQVDTGFNSTDILSIFRDSVLGTQASDTLTLGNLATLAIAGAFRQETYAQGSAAGMQNFLFSLSLSGVQPEIPLPAAAPLFMAGLAGFAAMRRRKRTA